MFGGKRTVTHPGLVHDVPLPVGAKLDGLAEAAGSSGAGRRAALVGGAVRRVLAHVVLAAVYGVTWLVALLGSARRRRPWRPTGRIIVTGTFHNPNWYLSHLVPLSRSGADEVILVVDEPQEPVEGVRFVCPPKWAATLFGRAGAKGIWLIAAALRCRPDLYMGYHIIPAACTALIAGRLFGRPACYQMTGGPVQIIGGGVYSENSLSAGLGKPSAFIERLATAVVRQFDLLVVRGHKAERFLAVRKPRGRIAIITGSVRPPAAKPTARRDIDMAFVGRLSAVKQPQQFIEIVAEVCRAVPGLRAVVVGDGPLLPALRRTARQLGVADHIGFLGKRMDVDAILGRSKVFVLTSRSEGLSIAMAEAMFAGVVPVVADVGELGDLVTDGVNGFLVKPNRVAEYVKRIVPLLHDRDLWSICSRNANRAAKGYCSLPVVAGRWRTYLHETVTGSARPGPGPGGRRSARALA